MKFFYLMHKDIAIARINIKRNEFNQSLLHVLDIFNQDWMPWGTRQASGNALDEKITEWNDSRCIPTGRPNYDDFLSENNIQNNAELVAKSFMCSLTDCYWFKPDDVIVSWQDVNFRDNGFASNLYKRLFYNQDEPINNLNSPDLTTDGALPKMWVERNGKFYLIKYNQLGDKYDACAEMVCSKLLNQMDIPCVDYTIEHIDNKICSVCECFINTNEEEFVPMQAFKSETNFINNEDLMCFLRENGFALEIDSMIIADFCIGNTDRHLKNYGFIIDSNTGDIKRFAPLFDHGNADLFNQIGFLDYMPLEKSFDKSIQDISIQMSLPDKLAIDEILRNALYSQEELQQISDCINIRISNIGEHIIERDDIDEREL